MNCTPPKRPLAPSGGNDRVYTPIDVASDIIEHFGVSGKFLEPCRGKGAFYESYCGNQKDWCEIDDGKDFLDPKTQFLFDRYDWVVTNPPWSLMRPFLNRSMELSENVVFLCLVNAFWMKARLNDIEFNGFSIKEILFVPQPPKPWPSTGFALGATHIQKAYKGGVKLTKWSERNRR